jgi:DNA-binding NtrC family response regulator
MNPIPQFNHLELRREPLPDPRTVSRPCLPTLHPAGVNRVAVPPQRLLRVLCIDDDEQVLESMKACLTHFDHQVKVASGGKSGIELFCTAILKSEPYDVVITDMNMPDVNGHAVAQIIKAESPDTPVILMTGANNTTRDSGSIPGLVDAVLNKPARMKELNDLLLRITGPA